MRGISSLWIYTCSIKTFVKLKFKKDWLQWETDLSFQGTAPVSSNKHSACFVPPSWTPPLGECSFVLQENKVKRKTNKKNPPATLLLWNNVHLCETEYFFLFPRRRMTKDWLTPSAECQLFSSRLSDVPLLLRAPALEAFGCLAYLIVVR